MTSALDSNHVTVSENETALKARLLTNEIEATDTDLYNEDKSEIKYLLTQPVSFIILGKPGSGKTTVAKKLAEHWKAELINGISVIQEQIAKKTPVGKQLSETLASGNVITEETVMDLIKAKINSPEVHHRGYVLDDIPTATNRLDSSPVEQLTFFKTLRIPPRFIIYVRLADADLGERRVTAKADPVTGTLYVKRAYAPPPPPEKPMMEDAEKEEEEEEHEEEEEELEDTEEILDFPKVPPEVVERLVIRPEDLQQNVDELVQAFRENALQAIEDFVAGHQQPLVLELDGNQPPNTIFNQLLLFLKCHPICPAVIPQRFFKVRRERNAAADDDENADNEQAEEDEEAPNDEDEADEDEEEGGNIADDADADEVLRSLSSRKRPAPRFRWRRSKWLLSCPVKLHSGELYKSPPSNSVQFLDKIYVLSSLEAASQFIANPRPFLVPPQPRPPGKFVITGMPLTGKSTLAELLARRYGAVVIDLKKLMTPKIEEERIKAEEIEHSQQLAACIDRIRTMRMEALAQKRAASLVQRVAEEAGATDQEEHETTRPPGGLETIGETEENVEATGGENEEKTEADEASPEVTVSETDPEVVAMVAHTMAEFRKKEVVLPATMWVEVCRDAIREAEDRNSSRLGYKASGGWILDGFPATKDQWQELGGTECFPDHIIYLRDGSDRCQELAKRWFSKNRSTVIAQIRQRITKEAETRRNALEIERRRKYDEDLQRQQEMAASAAQATTGGNGEEAPPTDQPVEPTFEIPELEELPPIEESDSELMNFEKFVTESSENPDLIVDYAEIEMFRKELVDIEVDWNANIVPLLRQVVPSTSPYAADPILLNVEAHPSPDQLMEAAYKQLEAPFRYVGWEFGPIDAEEEDNDAEADQEDDEEEEGEGEEERSVESKRLFGETAEFCPVQLVERDILAPGNPDIAAKYREKVFYFSSEEAREKFLADPAHYVPQSSPPKPPPLRICLIGPKGCGKTLQGRQLAQKLGIFYVNFRERMQEIMLAKLGKRVGPEQKDQDDWNDLVKKDADVSKIVSELQRTDSEVAEGADLPESRGDDTDVTTRVGAETSTGVESNATADEEPQLNDNESAIRDNLELTDPTALPNNVLEYLLTEFWTNEPFNKSGFILEGFPRTEGEMRWLADAGLFPDCVVFLSVNSEDVVSRLIPGRMEAWFKRREKEKAQRALVSEARKKQRLILMAKRRDALLAQRAADRAAEKAEREAQKQADEGNDEEEEEEPEEEEEVEEEEDWAMIDATEVDAVLAEEFPEEDEVEEEEEQETEADAKERLEAEISEMCEAEKGSHEIIRDILSEIRVPSMEVDANRKPHIVRYMLSKKLRSCIEWRPSIFERPMNVKQDTAGKLLATGYKRLSRFGRWCPVKLADGECIPPIWDPPGVMYSSVYRSYVYYFSSQEARKQFQHEPLRFIGDTVPDPPPVVPIRLAIIGPPKSGKTTLAKRFAEKLKVIRLSAGEALRWLLANVPHAELALNIESFLRKGKTVPDELVVAAIEAAILGITGCRTRGYVLDGWPSTRAQAELLTAARITPFRVVELFVASEEVMTRGLRDRTSRDRSLMLHDSAQILALKLAAHRQQMPLIKQWYEVEHPGSFGRIDGFANRWAIWERSVSSVQDSIKSVQRYLTRALLGKAAPIFGLCIRPAELLGRLSPYGHYCPVALANGELINCVDDLAMANSAEYRGFYYRCSSKKALEEFVERPDSFVPPLAPYPLPPEHLLPIRLSEDQLTGLTPTFGGYCSVTFGDEKLRYEALVSGQKQFAVKYDNKLYLFANEARLKKFMKTPVRYADLQLPHKLPPPKEPLPLEALPALGYLEQTTANALVKALTAAGCRKPKLPFASAPRSALLYVALHLKAHNSNLPATHYSRQKYKRLLDEFSQACNLTQSLAKHVTVNFKEPALRFPKDFDSQMDSFFSLKDAPPVY